MWKSQSGLRDFMERNVDLFATLEQMEHAMAPRFAGCLRKAWSLKSLCSQISSFVGIYTQYHYKIIERSFKIPSPRCHVISNKLQGKNRFGTQLNVRKLCGFGASLAAWFMCTALLIVLSLLMRCHKFGQVEEAPLPVQQLASYLLAFLSASLSKTGGHQALTVLQRAMSEFESGPSVPTSGVHFAPWQTTVAVARQLVAEAVADSQKRVAEDVQAKEEEIESKISALKLKRQNLQSEKASLEQGLKRVQAELVQEEDRLAQLMGAQSAETAAMVVEENLSEDEGAFPQASEDLSLEKISSLFVKHSDSVRRFVTFVHGRNLALTCLCVVDLFHV